MPLSELTSPEAVRSAAAEYDRIGQDEFFAKYGFGKAREYFLQIGDKLYDSKAIAGAAYGYQFPDRGPLTSRDFGGGEATVRAKLEELRFTVVVIRHEAPARRAAALETMRNVALEKAFHVRMLEIYAIAKKDAGYNATRFLAMVSENGGLEAARTLLHSSTVSDGYVALWERGRLDLSVEAVVLEPRWAALFTGAELEIANRRLREYDYSVAP